MDHAFLLAYAATQSTTSNVFTLPVAIASLSFCIAVASFVVALTNLRLSRFPRVRIISKIYYEQSIEVPQGETYFDVEVESYGLPIWDMQVRLETDYRDAHPTIGNYCHSFEPVGSIPNPMNAGQVAKFRLTRTRFTEIDSDFIRRTVRVDELPKDKVAVCVYGSGDRLVRKITAKKINRYQFKCFDKITRSPAPTPE